METRDRLRQKAETPRRSGAPVWLALRVAVALGVGAAVWLSLALSWRMLRADLASQSGFRATKRPELAVTALAEFRRAHAIAPEMPLNQFRLANQLLQLEGTRYSARREINLDNLNEGLDLLKAALPGFHKKQLLYLRSGEVRVIFSDFHRQRGDMESAQRFAGLATDDLVAYRNIQGAPEIAPEVFYANAIKSASLYGRPQLALRLLDDYVRYNGHSAATRDPAVLEPVIQARQALGEFPFMMNEAGAMARREPGNEWLAGFLDRAARRMGQREAVLGILRDLERRDLLEGRMAALAANLR